MAGAWAYVAPRLAGEPICVTIPYNGKEVRILIPPGVETERNLPFLPAVRLELAAILQAIENGIQTGDDPVWQRD